MGGVGGRSWVGPGPCEGRRPRSQAPLLQAFDDFIFAFFAVEMVIKMIALGLFGQKCYLGDTWNRLDFFIVMAGYGPAPEGQPGATRCLVRPVWERPRGPQDERWGGALRRDGAQGVLGVGCPGQDLSRIPVSAPGTVGHTRGVQGGL